MAVIFKEGGRIIVMRYWSFQNFLEISRILFLFQKIGAKFGITQSRFRVFFSVRPAFHCDFSPFWVPFLLSFVFRTLEGTILGTFFCLKNIVLVSIFLKPNFFQTQFEKSKVTQTYFFRTFWNFWQFFKKSGAFFNFL